MGHAKRHPLAAFSYALPVSALAGLVGVGGAEFRLPVLVGALGYPEAFLGSAGEVFAVFDERTQDSGNISSFLYRTR